MGKTITCYLDNGGKHIIKLEDVKETYGHDDSLPFHCDIYLQDKDKGCLVKVGSAMNDGWGGETEITALNNDAVKKIDDVDTFLRKTYKIHLECEPTPIEWDVRLTYLIDCLVYRCLLGVVKTNVTSLEHCYSK
ncbi:MAG: hypothetical protein MJ237_06140 [bacterium]|nr:hypothetical protein [bacterium]